MAKLRSVFNVQGTLLGFTIVDSKKYGRHIRAARGTYKRAKVNDAFKNASIHLLAAQVPAKMIKNTLVHYREHFSGGQLWQRLVSLFCRQHMQHNAFDLTHLENMEVHEDFPLERLWRPQAQVSISPGNRALNVLISSSEHPVFRVAGHVDGYRVQVIALFPNLALSEASHAAALSPVIPLKSKVNDLALHLPLPGEANAFVICIKLEGMIKDTVMLGHSSKGMRIAKVGKI